MKTLLALLATGSLAFTFVSCERHSWDKETKNLFEEHGATEHGDGDKGHPGGGHKEGDHKDHDR